MLRKLTYTLKVAFIIAVAPILCFLLTPVAIVLVSIGGLVRIYQNAPD